MSSLKGKNILLVEDEPTLGETLGDFLKLKGAKVEWAKSCDEARALFSRNLHRDLIVLMDINLPDGNGIDLATQLRTESNQEFILLFLSAMNDPEYKLKGLEMGGHDYMTKPFDLRELMLRLERIIKAQNKAEPENSEVRIGELGISFNKFELKDSAGKTIKMSQKECLILKLLYHRKNHVVSRDQIITDIWGENSYPSNRTVDNYIVPLRKWLESSNQNLAKIVSIRGIGYKLEFNEKGLS